MNQKADKLENASGIQGKPPRNAKGQLLPGASLNPAGKPKGTKHASTLLKGLAYEKVKLKDGTEVSILRAMAMALAQKAMRGDVHAWDSFIDRLDGKPNQGIELEVSTPPVPIYGGKSNPKRRDTGSIKDI